jgi:hypothetical protein
VQLTARLSTWELELLLQYLEARIGAQVVERRVHFQEHQTVGSIGVRLLEPVYSFFIFSQPNVHDCEIIRGNIVLRRLRNQTGEQLLRVDPIS